jgi:hypothetical protein
MPEVSGIGEVPGEAFGLEGEESFGFLQAPLCKSGTPLFDPGQQLRVARIEMRGKHCKVVLVTERSGEVLAACGQPGSRREGVEGGGLVGEILHPLAEFVKAIIRGVCHAL